MVVDVVYDKMVSYEIGTEHVFFGGLLTHLDYHEAEILADLAQLNPSPASMQLAETVLIQKNYDQTPPGFRKLAHTIVAESADLLLARIRNAYGVSNNQLFWHFTQTDLTAEHKIQAKILFKECFKQTLTKYLQLPQ